MSGNDLSRARLAEYRQARTVDVLRELVHGRRERPSHRLLSDLIEAESRLAEFRAERGKLESTGGLLTSHERKAGDVLGPETTGIAIKVLQRMDQVPTSIVHLLDAARAPLVSFAINYSGDRFARLRLMTYVEGYSARAIDTVELLAGGGEQTINQLPTFFPSEVVGVTERTRATLHVEIDDLDQKQCELHRSFPIWLLPRTTAYLSVLDPTTNELNDLTPYLAAYVTPNVDSVLTVLREAASLHPKKAMVGYQGSAEMMAETVRAQVKAVYTALRQREIKYVNSVVCFGGGSAESLQRVRLPREALATQSANCIDGTVLMASVLEAASLDAAIVLVPGHAFLAYATSPSGDSWEYVETTMLGSDDFEAAHRQGAEEAAEYQTLAQTAGKSAYRFLPISMLRTHLQILPME